MKTNRKIIGGYIVFLFLVLTVFGIVNICQFKRKAPVLQDVAHRLSTADIRVVKIDSVTKESLTLHTTSRRIQVSADSVRKVLINTVKEPQITGDTLVVPSTADATLNIPTVEAVVTPDGKVHPVPFVWQDTRE